MAKRSLALRQHGRSAPRASKQIVVKKAGFASHANTDDVATGGKKCLRRRNTDDVATRAINLKLSAYPKVQVEQNCDENGEVIHVIVCREIRRCRSTRKHISLQFWNERIKCHNLKGTMAEALVAPTVEEQVPGDLNTAMALAHHANPAAKSSGKLMRYLEYAPALNRTSYYGLLCGACESPSLSRGMSLVVLQGVLKYTARVRADVTYPDYWLQIKNVVDNMLVEEWQRSSAKRMSRATFLRAWRAPLALFMDMSEATTVEQHADDNEEPCTRLVEKLMKSSLVGSELFSPESCVAELKSYVTEIERRLFDLEQVGFEGPEIAAFKTLCQHSAEALDDAIWKSCDAGGITLVFCGGSIVAPQLNPNDQWSHRWKARLKTISISNGKVRRLPHEAHLFGDTGVIPGVPQHVEVDPSLVFDFENARDFLLKQLGDGWCSVDKIRATIKSNYVELLKLDATFWLESLFIEQAFDKQIQEHLRNCMLNLLPGPREKRAISKVTSACRQLSTGPVVMAQKKPIEKEMTSAVDALVDMAEGGGPTADELSKLSTWMMVFMKRCENFAHTWHEDPCEIPGKVARKALYGSEAILHRYHNCWVMQPRVPEASDLKEFRMFRWMLGGDENAQVAEWQREAVVNSRARIALGKMKALEDLEAKTSTEKKRALQPDAMACAVIAAPPLKEKKKAKTLYVAPEVQAEEEDMEQEEDKGAGVLSFFGARAV